MSNIPSEELQNEREIEGRVCRTTFNSVSA